MSRRAFIGGGALADGDLQETYVLIAGQAPLQGPQRDHHQIVLVHAHGILPFARQHSDHLAGEFLQADLLPHYLRLSEEFPDHGLSHDTDGGPGPQFTVVEGPPGPQGPVGNPKILVVRARNLGRPVLVAVDGLEGLGGRRGHGRHKADLPEDRLGIRLLERNVAAALARSQALPRGNHEQIAAHGGDLLLDLEGGAPADGHHDDHRRHADDDAQNG